MFKIICFYSASIGSNITLNCLIEANPLSLNYWTFGSKSINVNNNNSNSSSNESKYKISINKTANDKHNLRLSIQSLSFEDVGHYQCHANNSLGHQMKQVEVHGKSNSYLLSFCCGVHSILVVTFPFFI